MLVVINMVFAIITHIIILSGNIIINMVVNIILIATTITNIYSVLFLIIIK